jgi:hypothetical protein
VFSHLPPWTIRNPDLVRKKKKSRECKKGKERRGERERGEKQRRKKIIIIIKRKE